jgi:gluconolactonase
MKPIMMNFLAYFSLCLFTACPRTKCPIDDLPVAVLNVDPQSTIFIDGKQFTDGIEGPAVDQNNNLYAVNFGKQGTIGKIRPNGNSTLFLTLPDSATGNGIRFYDSKMYLADHKGNRIFEISDSGEWSVYSRNIDMNQPNDLAIAQNGHIFCSDPNFAERTGSIWSLSRNDQKLIQVKSGLGVTNGIELSPDDKYLYVNESNTLQVLRYEIDWSNTPISLSDKTVFHIFSDGGVDGMRCDQNGNLYIARITSQEVAVLSPQGEQIHTVKLIGKNPTNVAFGGEDGKTVYITVKDTRNIEQFRTSVAGRSLLIP